MMHYQLSSLYGSTSIAEISTTRDVNVCVGEACSTVYISLANVKDDTIKVTKSVNDDDFLCISFLRKRKQIATIRRTSVCLTIFRPTSSLIRKTLISRSQRTMVCLPLQFVPLHLRRVNPWCCLTAPRSPTSRGISKIKVM